MDTKVVEIPVSRITDWDTFHEVFKNALGFPDFYGRNLDAWNDCMTSLDAPDDGMTSVTVQKGGIVILRIENGDDFERSPAQYEAVLECSAFVNHRRVQIGEAPVIALMLMGYYSPLPNTVSAK
jgi:hypothetical protein